MKIGITGGIGAGKSYVSQLLVQRGISVYDCDKAAKRLIRTSQDIRRKLTEIIGPSTYIDGQLNKSVVAQFLLESEQNAQAINSIVHPAVFHDFETSGMYWMESAILYESGINQLVNYVIVVTAPEEIRIQRVMQRDNISREKVQKWMKRQWPQEDIVRRADFEIVNDGIANLENQLSIVLSQLSYFPH